jgi:hypothetical protein
MSIKSRIDKLYRGTITDITSRITVKKNEQVIKQKTVGTNLNKMIELIVSL